MGQKPRLARLLLAFVLHAALGATPGPARADETPTGSLNATAHVGDHSLPSVAYVPRTYPPEIAWAAARARWRWGRSWRRSRSGSFTATPTCRCRCSAGGRWSRL